jgi:hypothetical protein
VREERKGLLTALALVLVTQFLEFHGVFSSAEGKVSDWYLRLSAQRSGGITKIAMLAIDDRDYKEFFLQKSPLDPVAVVRLVAAIVESQPSLAVLGVDLLTESGGYADQNLTSTVRHPPKPIVWAANAIPQVTNDVEQPLIETASFGWWLLGRHDVMRVQAGNVLGLPPVQSDDAWGIPIFPKDEDSTVRRVSREWRDPDPDHKPHPTWARTVACKARTELCGSAESAGEVYMPFDSPLASRDPVTVGNLFNCRKGGEAKEFCYEWERKPNTEWFLNNQIVLLGGTFSAARDFYLTPVGPRAGLTINALAVEGELRRFAVSDFPRPATIILDLSISLLIQFLFLKTARRSLRITRKRWWRSEQLTKNGISWRSGQAVTELSVESGGLIGISWRVWTSLFLTVSVALVVSVSFFLAYKFLWSSWIVIVLFSWPIDMFLELLAMNSKANRSERTSQPGNPR